MNRRNKSFLLVLAALTVALFVASLGALTRPALAQATSADLSISGSANPDPATVGQELTYNLSVENAGPDTATNVVVKDTLPAGVEFVSATVNGFDPCSQAAGIVTCTVGDMVACDFASVEIVVRPTSTGAIENVATVRSDTQDPDATNNSNTIQTTVVKGPTTIISEGPLTNITITGDLNCQVKHVADGDSREFYDPDSDVGACGTLLAVGGELFGPSNIPAGASAGPRTPFTPISQSDVTGSGTEGDPYKVVTVVDLGTTGLRLTETDTYVVGKENYRSDVKVENLGNTSRNAILYRAGDCYLQGSDVGFGGADPASGSVLCRAAKTDAAGNPVPDTRVIEWLPLSPGSNYYEAGFGEVWTKIGEQAPFPNTCRCSEAIDNGAGLSWSITLAPGASATRSQLTNFSPQGVTLAPSTDLSISATDSPDPASVGGDLTYILKVTNNGPDPATGVVVEDTLPANVEFVSASASQGTCSGTVTVTCNVGDLASGASATVTIVVRPTAGAVPSISNTATVKGTEQDPDNANNSVTESTAVGGTPPPGTTPPDTTIDSGPTGTVSSKTANFSFSSSEANSTFECSLDGAPFAACSSPKEYTSLSDGQHTFEVKATDTAGNTDASPASRTWTVDATAPTVSSVSPADGATDVAASTNVTATFSEAMGAASINGSNFTLTKQGAASPVAAAVSYDAAAKKATLNPNADLQPGANYTATIKGGASGAKDSAGNALAADKTWSFTIVVPGDNVAPEGTVKINGGKAYATRTAVTLTLSANDPAPGTGVTSMRLVNDGGAWSDWEPYATSKSWTLNNAQGKRTVSVQYRDEAGNVSTTALDRIILDTVHPKVIRKSPAGAPGGISARVGARNVSPTANVTATFSEKMNPRTITNRSIILRRDLGRGRYQSVRARVTYNARTKTATLNPSGRLIRGGVYVATVFQSNKDLAGNRLDQYTGLRGENGLFWRFQIKR